MKSLKSVHAIDSMITLIIFGTMDGNRNGSTAKEGQDCT